MEGAHTMKILVTVASRHGSTAMIGDCIREELEGLGHRTHVVPAELVDDVSSYDAVVLGSAVYAGRWLGAARKVAARFEADLRRRPVWLFSSGPVGDPAKPSQPPAEALELTQRLNARDHQVFEGRLDRGQLGIGERLVVRAFRAPSGDYRPWPAVAAWARMIGDSLDREAALATASPPPEPTAAGALG
jgi:menaquinone-dependent protoporphyrinogen oxidase